MHPSQQSIGSEKAIALAESHWWELCTFREIAEFQMFTAELCMPFDKFHEALEKAIGRPVFTHEIAMNFGGLAAELRGERAAPTLEEIIEMIPAEKRCIIAIAAAP